MERRTNEPRQRCDSHTPDPSKLAQRPNPRNARERASAANRTQGFGSRNSRRVESDSTASAHRWCEWTTRSWPTCAEEPTAETQDSHHQCEGNPGCLHTRPPWAKGRPALAPCKMHAQSLAPLLPTHPLFWGVGAAWICALSSSSTTTGSFATNFATTELFAQLCQLCQIGFASSRRQPRLPSRSSSVPLSSAKCRCLRSCARRWPPNHPPATASTAKHRCACVRGGDHRRPGAAARSCAAAATRRRPSAAALVCAAAATGHSIDGQVPLRSCARRWPADGRFTQTQWGKECSIKHE